MNIELLTEARNQSETLLGVMEQMLSQSGFNGDERRVINDQITNLMALTAILDGLFFRFDHGELTEAPVRFTADGDVAQIALPKGFKPVHD